MVKTYMCLAAVAAIIAYLFNLASLQNDGHGINCSSQLGNSTGQQFQSINNETQTNTIKDIKLITVIGGPGSGKGTNCLYLKQKYGYKHISSGDLLRDQILSRGPLSEQLQKYLIEGKLVPSSIIVRLITNTIHSFHDGDVVLLDGFPRNLQNLEEWEKVNGGRMKINYVLYFDCPLSIMKNRLMERGKISGRADDNAETIEKRLQIYQKQTIEVIKQFQANSQVKIIKIDTQGSFDQVAQRMMQKITELQLPNNL